MTLISKLKEAGLKADSGPWLYDQNITWVVENGESVNYTDNYFSIINDNEKCVAVVDINSRENAEYITLCSPSNILLLIEKLRIATEALERIHGMSERPVCICGVVTGTAAIKACSKKALSKMEMEK